MKKELINSILNLEKALMDPGVRNDARRIRELVKEDFFEWCSNGTGYQYKTGDTFTVKEGPIYEITGGFDVKQLSDTVVLATYISKRTVQGQVTYANRSSVWVLEDSGWKMAFHQGTPTDE